MCLQLDSGSVPDVWLNQQNWSSENRVENHFKNSTKDVWVCVGVWKERREGAAVGIEKQKQASQ